MSSQVSPVRANPRLALTCSACGYGIARPSPPERCPMCHREGTWIHRPWRPFTADP
jgi:rubrerythrin